MEFEDYLEKTRLTIKQHLHKYFKKRMEDNIPSLFKEQRFIEELEDFVLRGKLLRGTLFLFTVEGLSENITTEYLDIACAIELMHSSLLIQDDIIDNDYSRRGTKTIFAKYEEEGEKRSAFNAYHYGISSAIIVADVAFFYALDLLSNYKGNYLNSLLKYYSNEVYMVALAEGADSIFGQTKKEPTKNEIYDVYKYKTARYTFSLPFEMGVIALGKPDLTKKLLGELGELVGVIFQLKDDEIGLFGDAKMIGKPVGSDIRENKKTIIRYFLYKHANGQDKKILDKCFGNPIAGSDEIQAIKEIYKKLEIQEVIDKEADGIMTKAWKIYDQIPLKPNSKKLLKDLLGYNLSRSY